MILDLAYAVHERKCARYRGPRRRGIAYPFGVPEGMPPHRWRVSWDVMQALTEASPPPAGDNPKTADGAVKLLFGWPIDLDVEAHPGTLRLLVTW